MLITLPRPRSSIPLRKRLVRSTTASQLTLTISIIRSRGLVAKSAWCPKPALLTRTSTILSRLRISSSSCSRWEGSPTSQAITSAEIPCSPSRSAASVRSRSSRRATRASEWPREASSRAMAAPIPEEAPVTIAMLLTEGCGRPIGIRRTGGCASVLQALAGLSDQRHRLGEDDPDRVADLHGLLVARSAELERADRRDGHLDGELDRVVGP